MLPHSLLLAKRTIYFLFQYDGLTPPVCCFLSYQTFIFFFSNRRKTTMSSLTPTLTEYISVLCVSASLHTPTDGESTASSLNLPFTTKIATNLRSGGLLGYFRKTVSVRDWLLSS